MIEQKISNIKINYKQKNEELAYIFINFDLIKSDEIKISYLKLIIDECEREIKKIKKDKEIWVIAPGLKAERVDNGD